MTGALLRLDDFLPFRLSVTSNLVSETIADTYRALFGLSIPEWRLIAVIAEQDGITQQQAGKRMRLDKVTVSRATIALARRALVERRAHASDRRSRHLHLTPSGAHLYRAVAPKAIELEQRIFARFDRQALAEFTAMLHAIDAATMEARVDLRGDESARG